MTTDTFNGWVHDIEIDPSNRDHILHVHGGGIAETKNASSATPTCLRRRPRHALHQLIGTPINEAQ